MGKTSMVVKVGPEYMASPTAKTVITGIAKCLEWDPTLKNYRSKNIAVDLCIACYKLDANPQFVIRDICDNVGFSHLKSAVILSDLVTVETHLRRYLPTWDNEGNIWDHACHVVLWDKWSIRNADIDVMFQWDISIGRKHLC